MKIAIYEPEPRVCGPMTWAYHLRFGFAELGHEAHVVTSTKSGRNRVAWGETRLGTRWWTCAPDVVCRNDELVETLNGYDRVILTDVRTIAQDKAAVKEGRLPIYVDALLKTSTPWTSAFHGNAYPPSETVYTGQLLGSPSWVGALVDQTKTSIRTNPLFDGVDTAYSGLPYRMVNDIDAPPTADLNTVGITGRFIFNKGHHVVALATPYLWPEVNVELWGSCSIGQGPNPTYIVWEALRKNAGESGGEGTNFVRHGNVPESPDGGNIIQPFNWDAYMDEGRHCHYLGNYTEQVATSSRLGIHVNLTTHGFSSLNVEYSTLEAIDAGCLPIVTSNVSSSLYRTRVIPGVENWSGVERLARDDVTVRDVAKIINETHDYALSSPGWRREVVSHNRTAVALVNNPVRVAKTFLDVLG